VYRSGKQNTFGADAVVEIDTAYFRLLPTLERRSVGCHTHTQPFTAHWTLSGTTRVSRYQKGKTSLYFTEARDSEWQWHQLGHMQICISPQTDNHTTTQHSVFTV